MKERDRDGRWIQMSDMSETNCSGSRSGHGGTDEIQLDTIADMILGPETGLISMLDPDSGAEMRTHDRAGATPRNERDRGLHYDRRM